MLLGLVSDIAQAASEQVVAAGSGSLDFEAAPPLGGQPLDQLFNAGGYTELGLSLHGESQAGTGAATGLLADMTDPVDDILSAVAGQTAPDGQASLSLSQISHTHLVSDIGLHGLGL
jgi:hypothetical protein